MIILHKSPTRSAQLPSLSPPKKDILVLEIFWYLNMIDNWPNISNNLSKYLNSGEEQTFFLE